MNALRMLTILSVLMTVSLAGAYGGRAYELPAQSTTTIVVDGETDVASDRISLNMGGNQDLRILRVVTSGGIDIEFADAQPQDASAFFASNPLPADPAISVRVLNPLSRDASITITVRPNERSY